MMEEHRKMKMKSNAERERERERGGRVMENISQA